MSNQHPAFYITGNGAELVENYASYAVMAVEPMALRDNRPSRAGDVYYTAEQMRRAGIRNDSDLRIMLDTGLAVFIKEPYFIIWEVGADTPMTKKYYNLQGACRVAHALAVSEPVGYATTK